MLTSGTSASASLISAPSEATASFRLAAVSGATLPLSSTVPSSLSLILNSGSLSPAGSGSATSTDSVPASGSTTSVEVSGGVATASGASTRRLF